MAPVQDAVAAGIVTNLAHPGGNVTGTMLYGSELAGKRVDVFKAAVPAIARIAVLGTRSQLTQLLWPKTQTAAGPLGLEARLFTVQDPEELFRHFRCHRAGQRQWFARLGRPSVLQRAADDHRAYSEASSASHL